MTRFAKDAVAILAASAMLSTSLPAFAQTPSDLRDLVGARGGQAEGAVTARGYRFVRTSEGSGAKWSYWSKGRDCVRITTSDGRYQAIDTVASGECGSSGSSDSSAAGAALLAGAAILGIAALAHHQNHHRDGQHSDDADNEAEYDRGFSDGQHDNGFNNYSRTAAYSDGYDAGQTERQNRAAYSRHPAYRGGDDGRAPAGGQRACVMDAENNWNLPRGSVVPVRSGANGDGTWYVTVQAGYRTATCTVDRDGAVRQID